jgi:hypothetical protein
MTDTTYKTGTCKWCGNKDEIYRDTMLCEECDTDTIYCRVCRERCSYEYKCRHVFQDDCFQWHGAGVSSDDDDVKVPFQRFLSAMGEDFARDLKTGIRSGRFHTWMVAPMIGGGGSLTLYGMPDRDGQMMLHSWGDKIIDLGESRRAGEFASGYSWLVSLYNRSTTKANRTTIRWIDQWLWPTTPSFATERPGRLAL